MIRREPVTGAMFSRLPPFGLIQTKLVGIDCQQKLCDRDIDRPAPRGIDGEPEAGGAWETLSTEALEPVS